MESLTPFVSKQFESGTLTEPRSVSIDTWLNSLARPGIGMSVVGYVMTPSGSVLITVKRWKLIDPFAKMFPPRPAPTTIDEEFEAPSVRYDDEDNETQHGGKE